MDKGHVHIYHKIILQHEKNPTAVPGIELGTSRSLSIDITTEPLRCTS